MVLAGRGGTLQSDNKIDMLNAQTVLGLWENNAAGPNPKITFTYILSLVQC
jgi:hypothetical protein